MITINNAFKKRHVLLTHGLITCLLCLLIAIAPASYGQKYDPGTGKTILVVGQTFQSEYKNYADGIGIKPAGSSHYGSIYLGTLEQGDDDPDAKFLDWVRNYQTNPYALIALSIKDNTAAGGYGQMISPDWDQFNPNSVHDALTAINNGEWDARIDQFAQTFASRPDVKFFVRIGYEVSLLMFGYKGETYVNDWLTTQTDQGINVFENPDTVAEMDRQAYIAAYNRIANRIKAKANNVAFVYHPVRGFNDTKWLYPGDTNVDYVAFSVFNNDICMEVNGTFNCEGKTVDPQLQLSMDFAKARNKPLIIAESAAQAPATGSVSEFKTYLDRLHQVVVNNDVRLLAYINSDWPIHGWDANWGDSRVEVNTSVKNHWKGIYTQGRYIQGNGTPTGGTTPAAPSNLQASATSQTQVSLSWVDNASNESGFYIERATQGGVFTQVASVSANVRSYNDQTLTQGTTYQYRVRAYNSNGNSGYTQVASVTTPANNGGSGGDCAGDCPPGYKLYLCGRCWTSQAQAIAGGCTEVCDNGGATTPAAPTGLQASSLTSQQVSLSWVDNANNETGYYVEQATGSGVFSQVAILGANVTTYNSAGLNASTTYRFRVRAYNNAGNSAYSDIASATTLATGNTCNNGIQDGDETGIDCGGSCPDCLPVGDKVEGKLTPKNGKTLLIIGQDLKSVFDYTDSGFFPAPGGVTTYIAFHALNSASNPQYGALGEDPSGNPTNIDIDWGAGPLNAHSAANGYAQSALVLGINFANGNQFETWYPTGVQDIGAGRKTAEIKRLAAFCKKVNKPVYIRLGYEFDGTWNQYVSPQAYVQAFREIVKGVRAEGANNVAFVWQSSAYPPLGFPDLDAWYPGDEYVDWCGFSWFLSPNFGVSPSSQQLADAMLDFARRHNKPVMIAESAPQGYDLEAGTQSNINSGLDGAAGQNTRNKTGEQMWNEWFVPFFDYIHKNEDIIRAVAYINADWDAQTKWKPPYAEGYWGDSRVEANPTIRSKWLAETNTNFWLLGNANIGDQVRNTNSSRISQGIKQQVVTDNPVVVFPNPADKQQTVKISGLTQKVNCTFVDMQGVVKAKKQLLPGNSLDISFLKPGVYYIKITGTTQQAVKLLVVK
jgi:beta-mannanase